TKAGIRAEATRRGLAVAGKPDSHDICFIPSGDTRAFLADRLGSRPGELVDDQTGEILGSHHGVYGFTVGQRRGLGLSHPAPDCRPRFVLGLEPATGTVRVGPAAGLDVGVIEAERPVWAAGAPDGPLECVAQVRAHGGCASAVARAVNDRLLVQLREPLRGVAPGQAVALYRPDPDGDVVLASATITATR
ncbi:MAG: tRNA methyl transferase PRC-barrel domain-containing protein, partial [Pseudonocardiaceae bacterium]